MLFRSTGESPAASQGGVLITIKDTLQVSALPTDIPDKLTIDLSKLQDIGDGLGLKDIVVPTKVSLVDPEDTLIVRVDQPKKEEEA